MIRIAGADKSTYPDAMVICGDPVYADGRKIIVTNPVVVVEVLSPSPAAYDRGEKFAAPEGRVAVDQNGALWT